MNDRVEIILSVLLMLDQVAEQLRLLSMIEDFGMLSEAMMSYRDDFMRRAKVKQNDFDVYKRAVTGEVIGDETL